MILTNLPVIIVPIFNALDDVLECIESLRANTPPEAQILLVDDASTDPAVQPTLTALAAQHGLRYVRKPANTGFVGSCNLSFEMAKPHDVVIVNSDVIVPADWLPRLQAAAYHRSNIASATPFTNHGSILSLPHIDRPSHDLPLGLSLAEVDARVRNASLRLYPIIPTAIGHLTYIKRSALDAVVGVNATTGFDDAFAPGYGEEVDFSQRSIMAGFCHVVADDLFVHHKGSKSFGGPSSPQKEQRRREIQEAHERLINQRYPWYEAARGLNANEADSPFARAAVRARAALLGYHIAVDATCVSQYTTGTQVFTLELINAVIDRLLIQRQSPNQAITYSPIPFKLSLVVADGPLPDILQQVAARAGDLCTLMPIKTLRQRLKEDKTPPFDLLHRPFQLTSSRDLLFLLSSARRFIVSQLDCIAYANPSYALNAETWVAYRQLTERVFALADGITYISADARHDAKHRGLLIAPERECVAYLGVNHQLHLAEASADDVAKLRVKLGDVPFLLVLGTNFRHKNRVYAIHMLRALIAQHGWAGNLVFAGPNVASGGSVQEEAEAATGLESRVIYLGAIDEAQKSWLLQNAALVLYPSNYEGFGIVPFEAAQVGVPCLALRNTSVAEVLGDEVQYLENNDPQASVGLVWQMLTDRTVAAAQVAAIATRAGRFDWHKVAQETLAFYDRVLTLPARRPAHGAGLAAADLEEETAVVAVAANNWLQRGIKAINTLRREGRAGLRREIDQYLRWKRGQF